MRPGRHPLTDPQERKARRKLQRAEEPPKQRNRKRGFTYGGR